MYSMLAPNGWTCRNVEMIPGGEHRVGGWGGKVRRHSNANEQSERFI